MKLPTIPIVEIFVSIQGEGPWIGQRVVFVRVAGCDTRCPWCDTKYAWDVKGEGVKQMTAAEIVARVLELDPEVTKVVLTGGNPGLWDLDYTIRTLSQIGVEVGVETQGTRWPHWMVWAKVLVVSPKQHLEHWNLPPWVGGQGSVQDCVLKLVVFGRGDFEWAQMVHAKHPDVPMYLQTGNQAPEDRVDSHASELLRDTRQIVEWSLAEPTMRDVVILPQLHVLLWGNRRRV